MAAERSVIIRLKGDVGNYNTAMRNAGASTRSLKNELQQAERAEGGFSRQTNTATHAVRDLTGWTELNDKALHGLARAADDAGDEMRQMGRDAAVASVAVERLGNRAVTAATKLALARNAMARNARAVTLPVIGGGGAATSAGPVFTGSGRSLPRTLLDMLRGLLPAPAPGSGGGGGGLPTIPRIGGIPGPLVAGIAGAATVAAGPAILAGLGLAGLGAGIIAQARNPEVVAAYSRLGSRIGVALKKATHPFVAELVGSAGIFEQAWTRVEPGVSAMFAKLATDVQPFAEGLAGLVENVLPGIEHAIESPFLAQLSAELPGIGAALGDMFDMVAEGGAGAAVIFHEMASGLNALLRTVGATLLAVAKLGEAYGAVKASVGEAGGGWGSLISNTLFDEINALGGALDGAGPKAGNHAVMIDKVGGAYGDTAGNVRDLTRDLGKMSDAVDIVFGRQMDVDEANLRVNLGLIELRETLQKNKGTIDEHTRAGLENRQAILDQVDALRLQRDKQIASGVETAVANAAYHRQIDELRGVLTVAGLNAAQIEVLIGKYDRIPTNIDTLLTITVDDRALGVLGRNLKNLFGSYPVGGVVAEGFGAAPKKPKRRARGGAVVADEAYWVGEEGVPELFMPGVSGTVVPARDVLTAAATAVTPVSVLQQAAASPAASARASAGIDYDKLGTAVAGKLAPALAAQLGPMLAAVANRPAQHHLRIGARDVALAVREGNRDLRFT